MTDAAPEQTAPLGFADQFAHRVATRDNVIPPPPSSQTHAAIGGRVAEWLRTQHGAGDIRSRTVLTQMVLLLLARPEVTTAELQAVALLGPRATARTTLRLANQGITEWFYRSGSRTRCHRLTRAAEDALLVVVAGPQVAVV